jgi:prephenate dehydratase
VGLHIRVAYSGEPGAFAEDAMLAYFGGAGRGATGAPDSTPLPGFRQVFDAVTEGRLESDTRDAALIAAGVLPIENVVNGTVREVYDLLLEYDLAITGEVVVPVHLCLAALPGQSLEQIERVYSHIQALGQSEAFLRRRPWSLLTTYNTAGAAKLIAERGETGAAAVLSPRAAALFGLEILAAPVQDVPDNRTRFLVLERPTAAGRAPAGSAGSEPASMPRPGSAARPMRTTLVFGTPNEPGSLHRLLGILAGAGINMSKLESRPLRSRPWEYVFWAELDAHAADPATAAALDELRAAATMLRVLGSYPRAE